MKRILLHTCCAPCAIYVTEKLKENSFKVTNFYYNPNIHPKFEYRKRFKNFQTFAKINNLEYIEGRYEPEKYFEKIKGYEENKEKRCPLCYELRLEETVKLAKQKEIPYFTTTLLISPYQKQAQIAEIGKNLAKKYNTKFYFEDFTTGFTESQKKAKELELYRQKYCGCIFSKNNK